MEGTSYSSRRLFNEPSNRLATKPKATNHKADDLMASTLFTHSDPKPRSSKSKSGVQQDRDSSAESSSDPLDTLSPKKKVTRPPISARTTNKYSNMNLKFNKKTPTASQSSQTSDAPARSQTKNASSSPRHPHPSSSRTNSAMRSEPFNSKPSITRPKPTAKPSAASAVLNFSDDDDEAKEYHEPPKKPGPKPRPAYIRTTQAELVTSNNENKRASPKKPKIADKNTPVLTPIHSSDRQIKGKEKAKPAPFPMPPFTNATKKKLAREGTLPTPSSSQSTSRPDINLAKSGFNQTKNRIIFSDSDDDSGRGSSNFPMPSPLSQPSRRAPAAFPMAFSPAATPRANKRSSDDSDDDKMRKRRRDESPSPFSSRDRDPSFTFAEEDDALFLDPSIDPKTICPYCDEPLPPKPTVLLKKLLRAVEKKSRRFPRPMNPLGRKAPLEVFISLCQRHKFESKILPEAEAKGWPKEIAFDALEGRVKKMRLDLKQLLTDDEVRANSTFWKEVMHEVKQKGSRAASGVKNQFANFEKMQPGYYGEQGSVIIQHTLYDLFPPTSIDQSAIKPLSPNEFMQRILVPETAIRLIQDDLRVAHDKALKILRESSTYGVAMFPEDGGEWGEQQHHQNDDEMGVADKMIMERARKRRIELEEEEKGEELLKNPVTTKERPKPKPLRKQTESMSSIPDDVLRSDEVIDLDDHALGSDSARGSSPPQTGWSTSMKDSLYSSSDTDNETAIVKSGSMKRKGRKAGRRIASLASSPTKKRRRNVKLSYTDTELNKSSDSESSESLFSSKERQKSASLDVKDTPRPGRSRSKASDVDADVAMDIDDDKPTPRRPPQLRKPAPPPPQLSGKFCPLAAAREYRNEGYSWLLDDD